MSFLHDESLRAAAASALPAWTYPYLAGGAAAATATILLSKTLSSSTHKNGIPLPPGPPAKWFWEDPFPDRDSRAFEPLFEKYGPVVTLRSGSNVTIVIGRMDAANEIMEKEGAALADRPRAVAAGEILSRGMRLLLTPVGDRFRRLRRVAHTHLQPKSAEVYQEIQSASARNVISDILDDPKQFIEHTRRYSATVILRVMYGKTGRTTNLDSEVVRIRQVSKNFHLVIRPGSFLVDRLPWLRYVPGYGRRLEEFHKYESSLFREQMGKVKSAVAANDAGPSFVRTLLEHSSEHGLSEDEMSYLAGGLFGAGSDTTAAGIAVLIMAAACHPAAQARVQEELDEVIGKHRMPTFEDKDMLPQLQAFLLEAIRWKPLVPQGVAHRTTKDVIWRGYVIPAGATVYGNHWSISRDPDAFPDPYTFNPGRWLTEDGCLKPGVNLYTYGFGRRQCPGMHVANRSLYINLVNLLWAFRIKERSDAPIVETRNAFLNPGVYRVEPFEVVFVPRIEEQRLRDMLV